MKQDLDEKLCRDFPILFGGRDGNPNDTLMCFGFECGDGWEPLIRRLAEKLEHYNAYQQGDLFNCVVATQVKEKFGTLRFYTNFTVNEIESDIVTAEEESAETCEQCGKPGKLRTETGWLYTACDKHVKGKK